MVLLGIALLREPPLRSLTIRGCTRAVVERGAQVNPHFRIGVAVVGGRRNRFQSR